jgi:nucleoside-diphosphate kinase
VGSTEPKSAAPGTIRGDYAHISYAHADKKGVAIKNLIHASGNIGEAKAEIKLWFKNEEMHTYKTVYEVHTL